MKKARIATLLVALGAAAFSTMSASWAQEPAPGVKPAYYISEFRVTDPEGIKPYSAQVDPHSNPSEALIVRGGGNVVSLEGAGFEGHMVVIAFDSLDKAKAWYNSPEYENSNRSGTNRQCRASTLSKPPKLRPDPDCRSIAKLLRKNMRLARKVGARRFLFEE